MAVTSAKAMGQNSTGWQVTATTVKPDGTAKCSYVNREGKARDGRKKLKLCKWPDCLLVAGFREKALTL
jgi:hypothetical protein